MANMDHLIWYSLLSVPLYSKVFHLITLYLEYEFYQAHKVVDIVVVISSLYKLFYLSW